MVYSVQGSWMKENFDSEEMLNFNLFAQGGFHPRRCGSPYAIIPEHVLRQPRSAQGRYGGTGAIPSFIVPAS
jgi:hypothetical protein